MKSFVKTLSVTVLVCYSLISFFAWDFTALATCEPSLRIVFAFVTLFIASMAEALFIDIQNDKNDKSFHNSKRL
jgi:hypothetical protein